MTDNIEIIWQGPAALGEGPLWHPAEQALYWVDIDGQYIHRMNYVTSDYTHMKMPAQVGALAVRQKGGLIAGVGHEICFVDMVEGTITTKVTADTDLRFNDGKCDRHGRFWIGTMNLDAPTAKLYRYDAAGDLKIMQDDVYISNGLAWSLDNKIFYYTDSTVRKIYAYDFDVEAGDITNRRVFVETPEGEGVPDGLTIDSEGYLWSARWEGSKIVRYAPDGRVDREIKLPVSRPTSCMFGGPDLDVLFVTSCSQQLDEPNRLPSPAGAVLAIDVGVIGVAEPEFQG